MRQSGRKVMLKNRDVGLYQAAVFVTVAVLACLFARPYVFGSDRATFWVLGGAFWGVQCLLYACAYRSLTQRVTVDDAGLRIRNIVASQTVPWSHITGFASEATVNIRGRSWSGVQVLLLRTDRVVAIQALYSVAAERAEANAARLRSLAPRGATTSDRLSARAVPSRGPAGEAHAENGRAVVRSWAYWSANRDWGLMAWSCTAFFAVLIGGALIVDDMAMAGAVTLVVTVILTGLVVEWSRPWLAVTTDGLRFGRRRSRFIPWADVSSLMLMESLNRRMTRRCSMLWAVTERDRFPLWATLRPTREIDPLVQRIRSFAPAEPPPARRRRGPFAPSSDDPGVRR
ncbi:MAG: PH domain-containing protein [Acidimicrobiales bacterium]